jgi:uroporphyrinogen decarboxylase
MCGAIKEKMGFENYCLKLYDEPEMMEEIVEVRTELALDILPRAVEEADLDMMWFWEDMAFRNGPIIDPDTFGKLCVPRYRRLADWYRSRGGEIVAVDSDGDVRDLIPGWIEGGINHIWPLEPFAGMNVAALRDEYGQAFSMRGGVDKFCIGKGREAIDREIDKIAPVVQEGGYIPHIDHRLPDCHFEDYCYYIERKKELLGPRPPRQERLGGGAE